MAILILGDEADEHAQHMQRYLSTHGADVEFLDTLTFPAQTRLTLNPAGRDGALVLPHGRRLTFNEISAVYWRGFGGVGSSLLPNHEQAYIAENDSRSLLESLLLLLPARWVNGLAAYRSHQTKPAQLAQVAALGVRTPATLLSNDPDEVRAFAGKHDRCVFKPVQGGAHTRRLTEEHLSDENLANLSLAPITVQQELPGDNIRVFLAGDQVHACRIETDALDFRDDEDPPMQTIELPPDVADQSKRIAGELDLLWTGMDYRLDEQGRYCFLEANPSPMFLGFESRTGLPLTESLARLLLEA